MTHYRTRLAFVSQGLRVPGRGGGFTASGTSTGDVQDDQQGGVGNITKTFTFTLTGDVPATETFVVAFAAGEPNAEEPSVVNVIDFCGDVPELPEVEPCTAGEFTASVILPSGSRVVTLFARFEDITDPNAEPRIIGTPMDEVLTTNFENRAFFTLQRAGDTQDDQQEVPAMPNKGAGGLAGGIPVGGMTAASTPLFGAAYGLRRH